MKRIISMMVLTITLIVTLAGCKETCKSNGCHKPVFENGYCEYHFYLNRGINAINGLRKSMR